MPPTRWKLSGLLMSSCAQIAHRSHGCLACGHGRTWANPNCPARLHSSSKRRAEGCSSARCKSFDLRDIFAFRAWCHIRYHVSLAILHVCVHVSRLSAVASHRESQIDATRPFPVVLRRGPAWPRVAPSLPLLPEDWPTSTLVWNRQWFAVLRMCGCILVCHMSCHLSPYVSIRTRTKQSRFSIGLGPFREGHAGSAECETEDYEGAAT